MRKMSKLVLISLALLLIVAGCSNNGNSPSNDGSESPSNSGGSQNGESIELTFQHIGGTVPAQTEVLNEMAAAFSEQNPGVTVKVVNVGWGEAYSMFQRQVAVGQAPDLVMLTGQWASEYQKLGAFAPVDDLVSDEVLDIFLESGFVKGEDGKIYGLPWDGSIWSFFYRTDLFEAAGLDPASPPQDWNEMLEYAQALTSGDQYGLVIPAAGWEPDDYFLPFMWQAGNEVAIQDGDGWVSDIGSESGLAAAQYIYDLTNTHQVMPKTVTGMDWEGAANAFVSGNAAMMFNGMWVANSLLDNEELDGKWATAVSPAGPAQSAVLGYPNTLHITEQSEHKEVVGKLLEFIFAGDGEGPTYYDRFCEVTGVVGWTKEFSSTEFAQNPVFQPFVEQVPVSYNRPIVPQYEEFRQIHFNPAIQDLILGNITPEAFVQSMDEKFNELLAQ
ncbi:sugar ABC transporter substrate-binding protein [Xylanibacillus composti]|uniref:Bicyclomycin resistance protein n=1 Tax=Xylanibacillus composti TaxID=1572762 RepID=A0A8J4H4L9_9BACL|nr:sugar ABC transporter substrate-binding protein [Xylanibacillus composti]MDT9726056.1 sugar ABC transporter substrate-binding protein [Xylanibacillus composti]GIQ68799.1 bicyclomycin resistance protein [Xylanibacillus composti]